MGDDITAFGWLAASEYVRVGNNDYFGFSDGGGGNAGTTYLTLRPDAAGILKIASENNTNNEDLIFDMETTANEVLLKSDTGVTHIDTGSLGIQAPYVSTNRSLIRFCGQGPNGTTATYIGPILESEWNAQTADVTFAGTVCDRDWET